MKAVVIAMPGERPQALARRCIASAAHFGQEVDLFDAIHGEAADRFLQENGLTFDRNRYRIRGRWFDLHLNTPGWSPPLGVMGCFASHYSLWKRVQEPTLILEQDAVLTAPCPELTGLVNVNVRSYVETWNPFRRRGNYERLGPGLHPFTNIRNALRHSDGYVMGPDVARKAVRLAHERGLLPVDMFLNRFHFPELMQLYPGIVISDDSYTTVGYH